MSVVNRLKELRARHNLNQQKLADMVKVSRQTILSIEKGNYHPSIFLALNLAKALKVDVNELFYLEDDNNEKNSGIF